MTEDPFQTVGDGRPPRLSIALRIEQLQQKMREADAKEIADRSARIAVAHELFVELGTLVGGGKAFIRQITSQENIISVYLYTDERIDYKVIDEDKFTRNLYPDGDPEQKSREQVIDDWLRLLGYKIA